MPLIMPHTNNNEAQILFWISSPDTRVINLSCVYWHPAAGRTGLQLAVKVCIILKHEERNFQIQLAKPPPLPAEQSR